MADLTIAEVTDGIASVVSAAAGIEFAQSEDEMTENIIGVPMCQIYWETFDKSPDSETHHITFGDADTVPIYVTEHIINIDVVARQRSHLRLDMEAVAETVMAIDTVLEAQVAEPLFGVEGIKAFDYDAEALNFTLGADPDGVLYKGSRFILTVTLF